MSEIKIVKEAMVAFSKMGFRLFRANAGMGWTGKLVRVTKPTKVTLMPGDIILRKARPFHGLPTGFADTFGWKPVTITQHMVGKTLAIFTAIEFKDKGKATEGQDNFINTVKGAGGFAILARSVGEAISVGDDLDVDEG